MLRLPDLIRSNKDSPATSSLDDLVHAEIGAEVVWFFSQEIELMLRSFGVETADYTAGNRNTVSEDRGRSDGFDFDVVGEENGEIGDHGPPRR